METNTKGFDLDIRNEDRAIRKGNNFLKGDTEGGNPGDKKKESQNTGQMQVYLLESVTNPQEKTHPSFLAPNLDLVHQ